MPRYFESLRKKMPESVQKAASEKTQKILKVIGMNETESKIMISSSADMIYPDLIAAQKLAYEPCGLICKNIRKESESEEYSACVFEINSMCIKFRTGKITPTKIGQFVTLWKRIGNGPILPFDVDDPIDLFVINVRSAEHFGQFVFPKTVLLEKGVLSNSGKGGKRAMRVYPSCDRYGQ